MQVSKTQMLKTMMLLAGAVGAAFAGARLRARRGASSSDDQRDRPATPDGSDRSGPPATTGADAPPRVVVRTPGGELTDDPASQWADDGGGGMGGGQRQS